jgi:hypothetical protein
LDERGALELTPAGDNSIEHAEPGKMDQSRARWTI